MGIHVNLLINNRICREGIADYFKLSDEFILGAMFDSLSEADQRLALLSSDVLVVDSTVAGLFPLIHRVKSLNQSIKIVVIIFDHKYLFLHDCIAAGIEGLVTTSDGMEDLCNCIHNVHIGRICYPAEVTSLLMSPPQHRPLLVPSPHNNSNCGLTSRQIGIINLLESGFSNKEIARRLGIEISTVKNHVHQILQRLNAKSRCEAVAMYRRTQGRSMNAACDARIA